ncbi:MULTISPECIES: class I SAM-dependent methyltransferase [unclassified Gordonia (in: high G+C Gram-positive bacteria)]|uniref:class I SAM-dependent methyltransferase n=1 Tax=unclassified Gordonia (in: high G+C Gram-positive bacteria) TaxID=2657482 RepID=UPI000AD40423|nr:MULTISPECIES: class I SAM-dependent methyltransferase [unclassified Gordonia (in: high G+C Gram-positive bacteria)]
MGHDSHPHGHGHGHQHQHEHQGEDMVEMLELDAAVMGAYLDTATGHIRATLGREPSVIVDVGAGTGVGARALVRAFPTAEIIGVDASPEMTAHIDAAGHPSVRTAIADLDDGWPAALPDADVIWASSSLHHIADPDSFLRTAAAHLKPGGVLAIIEMTSPPMFLPSGNPLEERIAAAMSAQEMDPFADWTQAFSQADLDVVEGLDLSVEISEITPTVLRYGTSWLSRIRAGLADDLTADDLAAIDALVDDESPSSLARRTDLNVRSGRRMWITKPHSTTDTTL